MGSQLCRKVLFSFFYQKSFEKKNLQLGFKVKFFFVVWAETGEIVKANLSVSAFDVGFFFSAVLISRLDYWVLSVFLLLFFQS